MGQVRLGGSRQMADSSCIKALHQILFLATPTGLWTSSFATAPMALHRLCLLARMEGHRITTVGTPPCRVMVALSHSQAWRTTLSLPTAILPQIYLSATVYCSQRSSRA